MRYFYAIFLFAVLAVVTIAGFRGQTFKSPPRELFGDMERQPKIHHGQGESTFFADGRADRPHLAGTVPFIPRKQEVYPFLAPRDQFREDHYLATGFQANGEDYGSGIPLRISHESMLRGQQAYQIHCAVCHGRSGDGDGITKSYGMIATPTFHDDRIRSMADGEIYDIIVNGRNTMGAYGPKLSVEERWAVVAYVRALQRAAHASPEDLPAEKRKELGL